MPDQPDHATRSLQRPIAESAGAQAGESRAITTEARWPMAAAVLTVIALTILLPKELRPGPVGLAPGLEALLLLAMIVRDPGRISERSPLLRALSIGLVGLLVLASLLSTTLLVNELIHGGKLTNSADELLAAGASVWISTNIAFSLLYWELESGGSAERLFNPRRYPDIAFPQDLAPEIVRAGWKPRYVDFLYLGFTNATAFSPTDAMPLVPWAKLTMALQSVISLVILGLVIARAVNVFS